MAVVTNNGPLYMAKVLSTQQTALAGAEYSKGKVVSSLERFTIAVGDEATSTYAVGRLPREAVLLPGTTLHVTAAVTGTIDMGDVTYVDGLIDGYAGTANTSVNLMNAAWAAGAADVGKPLWELLGYAKVADAPRQIDLYITLVGSTQATAASEGWVNFLYTLQG